MCLTLLESNAWNGIKSFYKDLGVALSQHREDDPQVADHYAARAKQRYRRRLFLKSTSKQKVYFV